MHYKYLVLQKEMLKPLHLQMHTHDIRRNVNDRENTEKWTSLLTLLRQTPISQIVSRVPKPSAERRPSVKKDFPKKSQLA